MNITLDLVQTMGLAVVVLFLGRYLKGKVPIFQKYFIPAPVIGGLFYAILMLIGKQTGLYTVTLDKGLTNFLLVLFFTCTGFMASLHVIKRSGKQGAILAVAAVSLLFLQNLLGIGLSKLLGIHALLGVSMGSVAMSGGIGSAAAFGPSFEALGVQSATVTGIAAATFGLVMGSLVGGPVAKRLIERFDLKSSANNNEVVDLKDDDAHKRTPLGTVSVVLLTMAFGSVLVLLLNKTGITFPYYVGGVFAAAIVRNVCDYNDYKLKMSHIDLIGSISLSLFLVLVIMSLKIWQLFDLAIPMLVVLVSQMIMMVLFAYFVTFRLMGKDYEAAVMAAGHCGVGLGQTPNAVANMATVIDRFGPAPNAAVMLPVITVIFINICNPFVITLFMNLFS
ncbi:MAG: sodium/glutamate symporter [Gammaproteobacteria bacterium]|nr:sodium/glutamate symporter [Gammaproteobacteria bacterium]MBU1467617.1 sodium/glutamate symporter [Gammaproteobacteria bacterium]MBU2238807.1 sodium/glutamate symporter [Gammaproteobacteria bacterium]MBU2319854.1 sodium/glutamate symporter [Gammaproteobacteria bacterium]MBU2413367.1 sodium/glutamate symporter [Gammaproteobacteria bacterium]